jgi:hypothetical protein
MRKTLLTLILLIGMGIDSFAQDKAILVLWLADGTKTDIEVSQQPQIKFENDKVIITSSVLNMEYNADEILRFTYKGEGTAISPIHKDAGVSQEDGRLVFHGITSANQVSIYSTNGMRIPVSIVTADGHYSLSLSSIPSGVYILKVNGKTSKFTKR